MGIFLKPMEKRFAPGRWLAYHTALKGPVPQLDYRWEQIRW